MAINQQSFKAPEIGSLIKFRLEFDSTIFVDSDDNGSSYFNLELLQHRTTLADFEPIENSRNKNFAPIAPKVLLTNEENNVFLLKGNYAFRVISGEFFSIRYSDSRVSEDKCIGIGDRFDKIITQYRESPNLLAVIEAQLMEVAEAKQRLCEIPEKFDIDTAVGDQLTIIGKWLGFPRCHNVPSQTPVFGFDCVGVSSPYNLKGFCEGAFWLGCPQVASLDVCITEDELYRRFLYVRRYQITGKNDYITFSKCIITLFGDAASFLQSGTDLTVSTGRPLSDFERQFINVFERVLPRSLVSKVTILEN